MKAVEAQKGGRFVAVVHEATRRGYLTIRVTTEHAESPCLPYTRPPGKHTGRRGPKNVEPHLKRFWSARMSKQDRVRL